MLSILSGGLATGAASGCPGMKVSGRWATDICQGMSCLLAWPVEQVRDSASGRHRAGYAVTLRVLCEISVTVQHEGEHIIHIQKISLY